MSLPFNSAQAEDVPVLTAELCAGHGQHRAGAAPGMDPGPGPHRPHWLWHSGAVSEISVE